MSTDMIHDTIGQVDAERISQTLFYISKHPLPYRKLNYTRPGSDRNTLYEADDYLQKNLESWGYAVKKEGVQVQMRAGGWRGRWGWAPSV